jgi:hypothetical protein
MACSQHNIRSTYGTFGTDEQIQNVGANYLLADAGCAINSISLRLMQQENGLGVPGGTIGLNLAVGASPNSMVTVASASVAASAAPLDFSNLDPGDPMEPDFPMTEFVFASPYTVQSGDTLWMVTNYSNVTGGNPVHVRMFLDGNGGDGEGLWIFIGGFGWVADSVGNEFEYDVNGVGSQVLYVSNTGFRFPYPRWT